MKRTPCVGICSTTYGDLVCRGCMRFAHEIVGWNGFNEAQREAVWQRLLELRDGAVRSAVEVVDDLAYVPEYLGSLGLFDVSDPSTPTLIGSTYLTYRLTGDYLGSDPVCSKNVDRQDEIARLPFAVDEIVPQKRPMRVIDQLNPEDFGRFTP